MWDSEQEVEIVLPHNMGTRKTTILYSAGRDTPADYWLNAVIDIRKVGLKFESWGDDDQPAHYNELASASGQLSVRDVNAGYTVRELDDADIYDKLCNKAAFRKIKPRYTVPELEKLQGEKIVLDTSGNEYPPEMFESPMSKHARADSRYEVYVAYTKGDAPDLIGSAEEVEQAGGAARFISNHVYDIYGENYDGDDWESDSEQIWDDAKDYGCVMCSTQQ